MIKTKNCETCKKQFITRLAPAVEKRGRGRFCSASCATVYRKKVLRTGENRKCRKCKKVFYAKKSEDRRGSIRKYCSPQCCHNIGGKFISPDKYYIVNTPYGQMKEHRWVMVQHLGRPLLSTEIVHHINENKLDNSIKNLQIVTRSEHNRIHKFLNKK